MGGDRGGGRDKEKGGTALLWSIIGSLGLVLVLISGLILILLIVLYYYSIYIGTDTVMVLILELV